MNRTADRIERSPEPPPPLERGRMPAVLDKISNLGEGRKLKNLGSVAKLVNTFEPETEELSDDELRARTAEFKERAANGESLDDLLPEAFATVREAARRTIGQRHFDVQIMG